MAIINKINYLRGFAALYVVAHHAFPKNAYLLGLNFSHFFIFGQEAVILFFLLSGFIVNYSYEISNDKSFSLYFFRRFCRIYIPLAFVFFVGWILKCFYSGELVDPQIEVLLGNLLMLQDIKELKPGVLFDPYMGNNPLWSLSYEVWFYVLYFLVRLLNFDYIRRGVLVYICAGLSAILYIIYPVFFYRIFLYFGLWWTGVFLSDLYIREKYECRLFFVPMTGLFLITIANIFNVFLSTKLINHIIFGAHPFLEVRHFLRQFYLY